MEIVLKKHKLQAKNNYTHDMLPSNRREVFFDVVKLQWRALLLLGILVLLFAMPLQLLAWQQDGHMLQVQELTRDMPEEQLQAVYYQLAISNVIRNFAGILGWGLLGLGLAGIGRIIRQYAWEENVRVFTDFCKGVRDSGLHMTMLGILVGFLYAVSASLYQMLSYGPEYLSWVLLLQVGLSVILAVPVCCLCFAMLPVYSNSFSKHLLISFAVYLKNPLKILPAALCCGVIFVPMLIPVLPVHLAGGMIASILSPFVMLAWTLYSYNLFDTYINAERYPELIGKGILQKSDKYDWEDDK